METLKVLPGPLAAVFSNVPREQWPSALAILSPKTLKRGEFFVRVGEEANTLGLVIKGLIKKYYVTEDGEEFIKGFSREGEFTGPLIDMLQGTPARYFIEAMEDCELLVFPYSGLTTLYKLHPCWQELGRTIIERLFVERELREYELLTLTPQQRYLEFNKSFPQLDKRVPIKLIARYLGIHPVSLSRIRSRKAKKTKDGIRKNS